ncbi:hypothetical protein LMH73_023305 [Vibrio splendidus]|nr:hypothetical protein [Vibrio splendidus]MCC4883219.1 hypothetical protein [Vibrio splendidus]
MSIFRESQGFSVESPVFQESHLQQEVKQIKTNDEVFQEIFMKKHNMLHPDGRVHTGKVAVGGDANAYITVSVSPTFDEFETQIEPPIYPAVKALVDKGYHTISSCAGHPGRIHLQLGFGSDMARESFLQTVLNSGLPALTFVKRDHVANVKNSSAQDGEFNPRMGKVHEPEGDLNEYIIKINADGFNFQFKTDYKRWFFLDINIMDKSTNPIMWIKKHFFLMPQKQKILNQLTSLMESDKIKHYNEIYTVPKNSVFF